MNIISNNKISSFLTIYWMKIFLFYDEKSTLLLNKEV
jgi:hypothetical protein